jgi:hypothetical protein
MADVNINLLKQCIGIDQTVPGTTNKVVAEVSAIPAITGSVSVSNFPVTQPVSGTVTAADGQGIKIFDTRTSTYKGLQFNAEAPQVCAQNYLHAVSEGDITGHTSYAKLGYNGDVGTTEEDIITQGGVYPWIPAGGIALEVVSSNAADTLAGTGVQKVKITYLDTDYSQQTQTLDMNGTTPVPLTDTTILRVNSIRATQVGTAGVAVGNITCRLVGGAATIYRQIEIGFTRGRGLTYTVPLGKTLYLTSVVVSSSHADADKYVRWIGRAQVDDTAPTVKINFFQPFFEVITRNANFYREFEMPIKIPATADLKMSASCLAAGAIKRLVRNLINN